jgi:hypothetical protein
MSGRRAPQPAPEVVEPVPTEVIEYMTTAEEEDAHVGAKMESVVGMEEEKKCPYAILPKPGEPEPDWEAMTAEEQRTWLKKHDVKGTWQKKLLQKCKDVWEDMQAYIRASGEDLGAPMDDGEEQPDFTGWSMERKRVFLRRRDVKGIWSKYVDLKCAEIWSVEKSGEKYVHTPPSLGRSTKTRFPGQSVLPMSPLGPHAGLSDVPPMTISSHDFHELAGAAQKSDLKRVTDLLNSWSSKNMLPEEAPAPSGSVVEEMQSPMIHHSSPEGVTELRWVPTEISDAGVRSPKPKRVASTSGTPQPKRKKLANGAIGIVEDGDGDVAAEEQVAILQARLRELENQNAQLQQENQAFKSKAGK